MSILNLTEINAAMDAAFAKTLALPTPVKVAAHAIGDNATLRTDVYAGPLGSGFAVVATVALPWRKMTLAKQYGPETWRERPLPTPESLVAECRKVRAFHYDSEASVYDLADAETKMASTDAAVQMEGAAQKAAVLARRLEIKAAFPKPQ